MYRDHASSLDEHDRAVGAIQIAEGLIAGCTSNAARLRGPDRPERWRAATSLGDAFFEVWHHLDEACRVLKGRGINTMGYDELRAHVQTALVIDEADPMRSFDSAPLDDARRAVEELRLVVPGADWAAIAKRTIELVNDAPIASTGQRWRIGIIVGVFSLIVVTWATAMKPLKKIDPDAAMRREIAGLIEQRRTQISMLERFVGQHCDLPRVRDLMKLYVMDGRFEQAHTFGVNYEQACGADAIVHKWSNVAAPSHR